MSTFRSSEDEKPHLDEKAANQFIEDVDQTDDSIIRERQSKFASGIDAAMYEEALEKYGEDGSIDPETEKKLVRKIDRLLLPILGICYFFYYVDKTTLSYAAIFGIKKDLDLKPTEYSWLSSIFYFGWLIWAIPSNLIMQRSPPAYYLSFNIFMWGAVLMLQAISKNFATLAALRVISGAFEAIADPAFMLFTTMYYTRAEQPSRISIWYSFNGLGVGLGGLIGFAIGHIKGALQSWRYEFLIVGAVCAAWGISLSYTLSNSPTRHRWFTHDERLMMIARLKRNQTGIENRVIKWNQIREAFFDYKTWIFFSLGLIGNIPNGGISNFSTLVIKGLGFSTLETSLMALPQGALVMVFILTGAFLNDRLPKNSRTIVCMLFMIPTIAGGLGFLLAPEKAYVARLICFQAPRYQLGIGSLLVANCLEFLIFLILRFVFIYENKKKERAAAEAGVTHEDITAFSDLTDKENPNFRYVY
ncbi:hypothetical protein QFC20_007830 [Naganishia adeliensis]|uniref:Uncharacterized protein n=1 Tax=Naganishia adeliensis TaxID=92952 RepID=A0ACC2UV80_9TREE|nr:hypothetical protein QFC20_007830 [Naganishia adeliensis]